MPAMWVISPLGTSAILDVSMLGPRLVNRGPNLVTLLSYVYPDKMPIY